MIPTPLQAVILLVAGAVASGINAVAGGGSLISFPSLIGMGIGSKIANATNSVALWPGSISGGLGFINLLPKTGHYFKTLLIPTTLGSFLGAFLLLSTPQRVFDFVIPFLIATAASLLLLQRQVRQLVLSGGRKSLSPLTGMVLQFLVSTYGGYFGAGMGIMMLAAFALYMEGNIHELNAVKNWLGLIINFVCSMIFLVKGLVDLWPAVYLAIGSIIGGFVAAKYSQKMNPEKLRVAIAVYGFAMAGYFAWRALTKS